MQLTPKDSIPVRTCGKEQPPPSSSGPLPVLAASASSDQQGETSSTEYTTALLFANPGSGLHPARWSMGDREHRASLRPGFPGATWKQLLAVHPHPTIRDRVQRRRGPFPSQSPQDSGAGTAMTGRLASPPAQQLAFRSVTGGPVGNRLSGVGEAPSPRELRALPKGEGPPTLDRQVAAVGLCGQQRALYSVVDDPPRAARSGLTETCAQKHMHPTPHIHTDIQLGRGAASSRPGLLFLCVRRPRQPSPFGFWLHVFSERLTCVSHPSTHAQSPL